MKHIDSLVDKIKSNNQIINKKSSTLLDIHCREVMEIINLSLNYIQFDKIPNIKSFNLNVEYSNLIFFRHLCEHALKIGEYQSKSKNIQCYMNDKDGLYELWLLWNKEFCITHLTNEWFEKEQKFIDIREVIDYGQCAFRMYDGEFIWDIDGIVKIIEDNLKKTLASTETVRSSLEDKLTTLKTKPEVKYNND